MQKKMVLSDQTLKQLVKEVKKRPCVWNPDHDRYNDRYQMAKAWIEIAEVMQLPEERLRVKWKNLRDLYRREFKKFGPEQTYTGKWRYFHLLKFVTKTLDKARRKKNIKVNNNVSEVVKVHNETNDQGNTTKEELNEEDFEFEMEDEQEQDRNNEVEVYLDESFEEDPIPDKRNNLSTDNEDFDVMFLKSLAPYFKQLDPIRKLVVRSKMQDMLLNEIAAQNSASHLSAKKS